MHDSNKLYLLQYIFLDKYGILYYIKGANQHNTYGIPCLHVYISTDFRTCQQESTDFRIFGIPYNFEVLNMCTMYGIIEQLCSEKGIKPGKLCADLGISRGILSDLKAGRTKKLSSENVAKVSAYFGISTDYILGKETEKAPAETGKRSVSDDDIKFALFGGDGEITDAMYDEVRNFAAYVKQREASKKKE